MLFLIPFSQTTFSPLHIWKATWWCVAKALTERPLGVRPTREDPQRVSDPLPPSPPPTDPDGSPILLQVSSRRQAPLGLNATSPCNAETPSRAFISGSNETRVQGRSVRRDAPMSPEVTYQITWWDPQKGGLFQMGWMRKIITRETPVRSSYIDNPEKLLSFLQFWHLFQDIIQHALTVCMLKTFWWCLARVSIYMYSKQGGTGTMIPHSSKNMDIRSNICTIFWMKIGRNL